MALQKVHLRCYVRFKLRNCCALILSFSLREKEYSSPSPLGEGEERPGEGVQKNGSQLPASHFVLKKRLSISAWEQQEQQELFLQEQQEQLQEQESAWR